MEDKRSRRSQRGYASVLVVGMGLVLALFLGISIDWGILLRHRRAMQNACDAGALAGAMNLRSNQTDINGTARSTAERYARQDLTQNAIPQNAPNDPNPRPDLVTVTAQIPASGQVRVEMWRDVSMTLFRLVRDHVRVAAGCTARLVFIIPDDLVPLGLDYCLWAPNYSPAGVPLPARCGLPPYPPYDPAAPQCWRYLDLPFNQRPAPCQSFDITIAPNSSGGFGSGNTGLLNLCYQGQPFDCAGGGANEWNNFFCNAWCVGQAPPSGPLAPYCFDATPPPTGPRTNPVRDYSPCANLLTKPGVSLGQVRQGVNDRCANPDQDARFIKLLLLNPAFQDTGNGRYAVEIWGFAVFQIDCSNPTDVLPGGNRRIRGGFVSIVSGRITGRETDLDTGAFTIRLVQ